jgi:prevent-host-death family protein
MERLVNMHEAKSSLSALVAQVQDGEEIIIARAGKPVARIVAYSEPFTRQRFGALTGVIPYISAEDWAQSDRDMEEVWRL